ncbi:MAG: O-antigen ligase family protein [Acidobacteriota bacterium]|nr:O-antigen ligase family protein [Acidobacteriota bacterium]
MLLVVAAASYQLWVPEQAIERAKSTTQHGGDLVAGEQIADDSTQMRIEQYKSLGAMMLPRPILGSGYKSFPRMFKLYGTLGRAKGAHSTYCQIGTEEGIVGLVVLGILFAMMMALGLKGAFRLEDPLLSWLALGLFAGAVSMALCMATGARFEAQKIFGFYWLLMGIIDYELASRRMAAEPAGGGET